MHEPWTEIKSESDEDRRKLVRALHQEMGALQTYVYRDACRAAALAWCYDRDLYYSLAGDDVPEWVAPWVPWLTERLPGQDPARRGRFVASENVVRKGTDTVLAWMLTDLPRLRVGIEGTDLPSLLISKDRSAALNATTNGREARWQIERALIDVVLAGVGFIKPRVANGELCFESRRREQVLWDPYAAREREPSVIHEWYAVDNRALVAELKAQGKDLADVAKLVSELRCSDARRPPWAGDHSMPEDPYEWAAKQAGLLLSTEQVIVSEHYLLATGPEADDGRHLILAWGANGDHDAVVLHDVAFDRTTAPIVVWHYTPPRKGCQSVGVGDQLLRWQHKIDAANGRVTEEIEILGKTDLIGDETLFKHLVMPGVNLIPATPGTFTGDQRFSLTKKEPLSVQHLDWMTGLSGRALDNAGISPMLSDGVSQLGANAPAVALQNEERRVKTRLSRVLSARDYGLCRLGTETLHALDDLVARYPDTKASWTRDGEQVTQKWQDLMPANIDRVVEIETQGAFSSSFAAQLAAIQDFADRGLVSRTSQMLGMLDDPDMTRLTAYELAPIRLVLKQMRDLLADFGGENEKARRWSEAMPDQAIPYEVADEISQRTIWLAEATSTDEAAIVRLHTYREYLAQFAPQPAAPAPMPGAGAGQLTPEMAAGLAA